MSGFEIAALVVSIVGIVVLFCVDAYRSVGRVEKIEAEMRELRACGATRAVARELVELDATVLVTPRDVEIPLDLLGADGGLDLDDALDWLDYVEALS